MLFIVLILVLAALGLLVTALITALSLWAWVSIALSLLAGVLLLVDYFRRRAQRKRAAEPVAAKSDEAAEGEPADAAEVDDTEEPAAKPVLSAPGDPAEENTSPADAELIAGLDVEVVVVDEYPRYHVVECAWLTDRDTIPIAVKEARDLGFTPCARCTPDAKLAEAHRAAAR